MRVVFVTWAWPTHLFPMVPLAWGLRAAGHDVRVVSQPGLVEAIPRTGLPAVSVGEDIDVLGKLRTILETPADRAASNGARNRPRAASMFAELADTMVDGLVDFCRGWPPDLIVYEPTALAGPIAAAALDIPAVRHLYGPDIMSAPVFRSSEAELLGPIMQRHGLEHVDTLGHQTIDPCPSRMQVDTAPPGRLPVRYVPYNGFGAGLPPAWSSRKADRPRVCVTWGTTYSRIGEPYFLLPQVVSALSELDIELVVSITANQRESLGEVPEGVRVVESVPLYRILPTCDAVVAHGGIATSLTALACAGLPMLLIPRLPDHRFHAQRVVAAGAARGIALDDFFPATIASELSILLDQPSYRTAASQLRKEILAAPTPAEIASRLDELARTAD